MSQEVFDPKVFQHNVFQVGGVTATVPHGNAPIRFRPWPRQFDFRTLRAEFRSADERVVLEEVIEAAETASVDGEKVASAALLAKEIKRMHQIRLSELRVRRLIAKIRRDASFRAENARMKQEEDDESVLLLLN